MNGGERSDGLSDVDEYVSKVLDCLRRAVAEALERKRRLGQYAIVWREGRMVRLGPDGLVTPVDPTIDARPAS